MNMKMSVAGVVMVLVSTTSAAQVAPGLALDPLADYRYCGVPKRDATGAIVRSSKVLGAYRRLHVCPATGLSTGACPGWALDHVWPLDKGGCDAAFNLQWMPVDTPERRGIKSCARSSGVLCKDRYELQIFSDPVVIVR